MLVQLSIYLSIYLHPWNWLHGCHHLVYCASLPSCLHLTTFSPGFSSHAPISHHLHCHPVCLNSSTYTRVRTFHSTDLTFSLCWYCIYLYHPPTSRGSTLRALPLPFSLIRFLYSLNHLFSLDSI